MASRKPKKGAWLRIAVLAVACLAGCGAEEPAAVPPVVVPPAAEVPVEPEVDEVARLIAEFEGGSMMEKGKAAAALGRLGEKAAPAVPALVRALTGSDPMVSVFAATALGRLADSTDTALPALIRALDDERTARFGLTGIMLAKEHAAPAVPALIGLLKSDGELRMIAVTTLGVLGEAAREADRPIAALLALPDRHLRAAAAWALADIGTEDPEVRKALRQARDDTDLDVSAAAAFAVWRFGGDAERAVTALSLAVTEGGDRVRALIALGQMGRAAAGAVDVVLELASSGDPGLRRGALTALGAIGVADERVLRVLTEALKETDPSQQVAIHAALALGFLGSDAAPAARALAEQLLEHPLGTVAERSLDLIGAAAVPELKKMLEDETLPAKLRKKVEGVLAKLEKK